MGPCEGQNRALTCSLININGGRKMWTLAETELWSCQPCRQSWSFNYGENISAHTDVWISHSMFGQTVSKTLGSILSDVDLRTAQLVKLWNRHQSPFTLNFIKAIYFSTLWSWHVVYVPLMQILWTTHSRESLSSDEQRHYSQKWAYDAAFQILW